MVVRCRTTEWFATAHEQHGRHKTQSVHGGARGGGYDTRRKGLGGEGAYCSFCMPVFHSSRVKDPIVLQSIFQATTSMATFEGGRDSKSAHVFVGAKVSLR